MSASRPALPARSVMQDAAVLSVPRLRGVIHSYAVLPAVGLGVVLVVLAPAGRPRVAAVFYSVGLCVCLGVSALYHRGQWSSEIKAALAKLDHLTIFLLIAGTSTPVFLLCVGGRLGTTLLVVEWTGVACGIGFALLWRRPPVWAEVGPYLALGWLGVIALPSLVGSRGPAGLWLLIGGGALYTVGAVCYALERPNPWPTTFGFHEIFHSFVTAGASTHAVLIAIVVIAA